MSDEWRFRVEDERFRRSLSNFLIRMTDLRPMWPLVVPIFIGWMRQQFETEGEFGGEHWQPLSETYADRKEQLYPGKGILVAEGDLRQAASHPRRIITKNTLVLEVDWADKKGKPVELEWHQEGTDRMPARPLLFGEPLPPIARVELDGVAEFYVRESIRLSGLR